MVHASGYSQIGLARKNPTETVGTTNLCTRPKAAGLRFYVRSACGENCSATNRILRGTESRGKARVCDLLSKRR